VTRVLLLYQPIDGGVARHVVDLFDGLLARGHEPVLCGPAVASASALSGASLEDPPFVRLPVQRAVAPRRDVPALARYAAIVRRVHPDIVHAHSSKAGALARLGRALHPGVPVLYTPHGYAFAGFFSRELERSIYRQAERLMAPVTRFVITVCQAEARLAASIGPSSRVRVVYNGVDAASDVAPDPRLGELARSGPVVCTISQLRPGKGVETLIDAMAPVLSVHPSARLAIVGDGPLRRQLEHQAQALGVAHAVHFMGEHREPMAVLQASEVFAMPSWAESFPYAVLEAMSAALAIVATDVGGIPEALTQDRTGLLVAPGDAHATARALIRVLEDVQLRRRLGRAAEQEVQRFNRGAMVDGVCDVYEEALGPGA
jgi:glycosyltransferase involved in cell wall biosynthesis